MRIRSIKPEFWRSDDITSLDITTRLLFIGLWSYVDDHGRGRDNVQLIVADLFPLDDPRESFANVRDGLAKLLAQGLIVRYEVAGRQFLHIASWSKHQRVDKPQESRFPAPDDASSQVSAIPELVANVRESVANDPEIVAPGSGSMDQGAEEQGTDKSGARSATPAPRSRKKKIRLPEDFTPSDDAKSVVRDHCPGITAPTVDLSSRKFMDHYVNGKGSRETRVDWNNTWQNWVETDWARTPGVRAAAGPARSTSDARVADAAALSAKYRAMEQAAEQQQHRLEIA